MYDTIRIYYVKAYKVSSLTLHSPAADVVPVKLYVEGFVENVMATPWYGLPWGPVINPDIVDETVDFDIAKGVG
jgi:hypothetical protein